MDVEKKSRLTLAGFVLGVTGTGTVLSAGLLTLIIVLNKITRAEGTPSLSSQLMIALCGLTFAMGALVFFGSLGIWKLSVKGSAVNLGIGIVLLTLSQGLLIMLEDFVPANASLWVFLSVLYYMMGAAATLSGISGIIAYLTRSK
ncbi:hypothetical protein KEJ18_04390 [Candidatus Bathyarchaeota archaeon]|nr:hypothetical protein [Candidatus Bathyarchaeota archaeon]